MNFTRESEIRDSSINGIMYKVILIGDSEVGKTSILMRYLENKFTTEKVRTFGLDYKKKKITVLGKEIIINYWDTAGHEEYRMITANFLKGSSAIIIVADLSKEDSIIKLKEWNNMIKEYLDTKADIYLLGNKIDLYKNNDININNSSLSSKLPISLKEYEDIVVEYGWTFFKPVSAKTGENINEAFLKISENCVKQSEVDSRQKNFIQGSTITKQSVEEGKKQKSGCSC